MMKTNPKFKRIRNKILKKYPTAVTKMDNNGLYYVSDGSKRIGEDYMIPSQKTVFDALFWVSEVIKIDQNIQRTHPNRLDAASFEKKFERISKRNSRKN